MKNHTLEPHTAGVSAWFNLGARTISNRAPSTTRPPLRVVKSAPYTDFATARNGSKPHTPGRFHTPSHTRTWGILALFYLAYCATVLGLALFLGSGLSGCSEPGGPTTTAIIESIEMGLTADSCGCVPGAGYRDCRREHGCVEM